MKTIKYLLALSVLMQTVILKKDNKKLLKFRK